MYSIIHKFYLYFSIKFVIILRIGAGVDRYFKNQYIVTDLQILPIKYGCNRIKKSLSVCHDIMYHLTDTFFTTFLPIVLVEGGDNKNLKTNFL